MAGRPREPVDLLVAKGKKHLSKDEIEQRKNEEVDVPFVDVKPPKYLKGKKRINEFNHYASMLVQIGIFTELDVDVLAKYIIAKELYISYTNELEKVIEKQVILNKWDVLEEIVFRGDSEEDLRDLLERILRRQKGDDATVLMNLQDKAFKQCLACAKELGLTITSRCKLVVPQPPEDDEEL